MGPVLQSGRGGGRSSGFGGKRVEHDTDRGLPVAASAADGEDPAGDRLGRAQQPDLRRDVPGGQLRDEGDPGAGRDQAEED